jgi:1-phosphofructokinase family hexose kinase
MILTITLNSAIDKVLLLDELTPGLPMLASREVISIGGKGLDSSVVLRHLGCDTVGLAFVAGATGVELAELMKVYGIVPELVWADGQTRTIYVLAESRLKRVSHIKLGELIVRPEHCSRFLNAYQRRLAESAWVICAGSMPPSLPTSFYGNLAQIALDLGKPILIDSCGDGIHQVLPYHPTIIKMNNDEFEWTFKAHVKTMADLLEIGNQVFNTYQIQNLVITCGVHGILAFSKNDVFYAHAPVQEVVNAAGSGDAVSAALALCLSQNSDWPEALRLAAATSAAVVRTEGTADCRWEDIQAILPQVKIEVNPVIPLNEPIQ